MKIRSLVVSVAVVAAAAVCVRLGFWQVSRWHEKRALNVALRAALAARPVSIQVAPASLDSLRGRMVEARGRYDETRQVLLGARANAGSPGVDVVTPLVLSGGSSAVLVDRGWLYAADAATAHPEDCSEPGDRSVLGLADALRRGAGGAPIRRLAADSATLYSARWLDLDSLAGRFPYALAPFVIRQLPGPGLPEKPLRRRPQPLNEAMHASYAVQWFLFAAILLIGSAALAWSRRNGGATTVPPVET